MRDFLIPLGTVLAAVIVSAITLRTSRKTPHERLTALVEIAKNMPTHLDTEAVVHRAIIRELAGLDSSLDASKGSWVDEVKDWLGANFPRSLFVVSLAPLAVAIVVLRLVIAPLELPTPARLAVVIAFTSVISFVTFTVSHRLRRQHQRRIDRFIRDLAATIEMDRKIENAFRDRPDDVPPGTT